MSALLYFIAGHTSPVTRDVLDAHCLSHAFDSVPYNARLDGATPSGRSGTLLTDDKRLSPFTPAFLPDEQTWRERPAKFGPDVWVGYYTDSVPGPTDLARDAIIPGPTIQLADGNHWQVPLVRQHFGHCHSQTALPAYLDVDEHGEFTRGSVVDAHQSLLARVEPFWNAWHEAVSGAIENEETSFVVQCDSLVADAVAVLAANYRLDLFEAMLLRLFRTDGTAAEVLKLACDTDMAEWFMIQKKTAEVVSAS